MTTTPSRLMMPSMDGPCAVRGGLTLLVMATAFACGDDGPNGTEISDIAAPLAGDTQDIGVSGCFRASLPAAMAEIPVNGVDSVVGVWQAASPALRLSFDCGAFDVDYGINPTRDEAVVVDGHEARLRIYDESFDIDETSFDHVAVLRFVRSGGLGRLYLNVAVRYGDGDGDVALSTLATVRDIWQ